MGSPALTAATSTLEETLAGALDGRGVRSVFQPIVDLPRGIVVGYEALTRFGGQAGPPPDLLFEVAREEGVGPDLEAVALRRALAHRPDVPPNCFLSVNVDPECLDSAPVRSAFTDAGNLDGLVVEVSEPRPWQWNDLAPLIRRLRSEGARIAVDDPGAAYAGLRQLLEMRPSILKLDRGLIQGVDTDEAKAALVEMMGVFAVRIDARLLAEGVETPGEARRLTELEVPLVQGFLFGQPSEGWSELDRTVGSPARQPR